MKFKLQGKSLAVILTERTKFNLSTLVIKKTILLFLISYLFLCFLSNNLFLITSIHSYLPPHFISIFLGTSTLLSLLLLPLTLPWLVYFLGVASLIVMSPQAGFTGLLILLPAFTSQISSYVKLDLVLRVITTAIIIFCLSHLSTYNVYNPVMGHWKLGLGFSNPNILGLVSLILLMELPIIKDQFNRWVYYVSIGCFLASLIVSDSRTSILAYLIYLGLINWFARFNVNTNHLVGIISCLPFICLLISLGMTYWYKFSSNTVIKMIDLEMSNRWRQAAKFVDKYPYTLWGSNLNTGPQNALDPGYINALLRMGLIPTMLLLLIISIILFKLLKLGCYQLFVPLMVICIITISGNRLFNIINNPFLISAALTLIDNSTNPERTLKIR